MLSILKLHRYYQVCETINRTLRKVIAHEHKNLNYKVMTGPSILYGSEEIRRDLNRSYAAEEMKLLRYVHGYTKLEKIMVPNE